MVDLVEKACCFSIDSYDLYLFSPRDEEKKTQRWLTHIACDEEEGCIVISCFAVISHLQGPQILRHRPSQTNGPKSWHLFSNWTRSCYEANSLPISKPANEMRGLGVLLVPPAPALHRRQVLELFTIKIQIDAEMQMQMQAAGRGLFCFAH